MDDQERLRHMKACPFCGNTCLSIAEWMDDDGQYDAIECRLCKSAAPLTVWNLRQPPQPKAERWPAKT